MYTDRGVRAMPVSIGIDSKRGEERLRRLAQRAISAGATECRIRPTLVLEWLSEMKGKSVLKMLNRAKEEAIKDMAAPRVGKAMAKDWPTQAAGDAAIAKQFRYWGYKLIETLWTYARDGGWGRVHPRTLWEKRGKESLVGKGYATGKTVAQARARWRKQRRIEMADKGIPPESWGVRHRVPAWHAILKGKRNRGKKGSAPAQTSPAAKDLITVTIKGRRIRREP